MSREYKIRSIDLGVQLVALIAGIAANLRLPAYYMVMYSYFPVIWVQVTSCIYNKYRWPLTLRSPGRKTYGWVLAAWFIAMLPTWLLYKLHWQSATAIVTPGLYHVLFAMARFISPLSLALMIWYFVITIRELLKAKTYVDGSGSENNMATYDPGHSKRGTTQIIVVAKWFELTAQLIALFMAAITDSDKMMAFYVYVGAVQSLACLLNRIFLPKACRNPSRIGYEIILGVLALYASIGSAGNFSSDIFGVVFVILIFGSPVLAAWYLLITILELVKAYGMLRAMAPEEPFQDGDI